MSNEAIHLSPEQDDEGDPLRTPNCPACGVLRPAGRRIFCSRRCAAADRAIWSLLLEAGDQVDMPFLAGSATRIAGTQPGDLLYLRASVASVLHVRAVAELRNARGHLIGLEAADVHGRRAARRQRIEAGDLEGWTQYGRIGSGGEFVQAGGRP